MDYVVGWRDIKYREEKSGKVAKNGNHVGKESSFTSLQKTKTAPAAGDVSVERR